MSNIEFPWNHITWWSVVSVTLPQPQIRFFSKLFLVVVKTSNFWPLASDFMHFWQTICWNTFDRAVNWCSLMTNRFGQVFWQTLFRDTFLYILTRLTKIPFQCFTCFKQFCQFQILRVKQNSNSWSFQFYDRFFLIFFRQGSFILNSFIWLNVDGFNVVRGFKLGRLSPNRW